MALDTGTIFTTLELDDTRFTRGLQTAERNARSLATNLDRSAQGMRGSLNTADRALTDLGNSARDASTDVRRLDSVPSGLAQSARDAEQALGRIGDTAERSGRQVADGLGGQAGGDTGDRFLSGFSDSISSISSKAGPIAGSILGVAALGLGVGVALASAIKDGMQQELQRDLFQAQTGTTVAQAEKFAQAAGEAYANVFGESIEGNLGTVKAALANGLLDPGATQRDAEAVISSLDGVATILGEDIPNVARAAGNAVKSGFATDVNDAFDLLVKGGQMGLNASEDLVDTVTEYSVQFEKVGLSGAEAFGLMNQAVQAGARDTDTAADAIKEFAIRSIDGSKEAGEAYSALGMNAEDMIERIGRGGEDGSAAMGDLLTAIRQTEDPIARNAIAVGLFGTKAEDLGNAMNELDLTSAMQSMNDYEGAAKSAIDVMGGNAATSVEGAMRSISTVADGLKASLAEAFGPQIAEWANNISNNRAGVIEFFIGIGNAGFDAAKAVASFVADGMRMLGEFAGSAAETGASFLDMGANILAVGESIPGFGSLLGIATDGAADKLRDLADSTRNGGTAIEDALTKGATVIDDTLIPGIDAAQERFNGFAGDMQLSAAFNDEIQKVNDAISSLGEQADGTILQLEGFTGAAGDMLPPGLADQLRGLTSGFEAQTRTGLEAGATVEELTAQYAANRGAILDQAMAMGLTNTEALNLINSYGLVPDLVDTQINQPGMPEATVALDVLKDKVIGVPNGKTIVTEALTKDSLDALSALNVKTRTLEDGTVEVYADTDEGQVAIDNFISNNRNKSVSMFVELQQRRIGYWESQGVSAADAPSMQGPVPTPISAPGRAGGGEFADGGAITGAGGPRSDNIPLWASPGEHMLDAEDVKNLGGQAGVYRFRAALENGQVGAFADGGAIGNRDAAISYAQSKNGMPYEYGKLDCSGYWSGIFNAYTGQSVRFTTDSDFAALGFQPGFDPGGFNIGTNGGTGTNGHMAGTLFGTDAESGSSGIVFGAGAQGAQDFPMVWHYPTGDDPATEALTGDSATGSAGADGSGGGSSTTGSNGARGGDVRDVFVTNWPSSAVSSKPSSGGSGGGSPQAGGAAAKAVDTESTPQARIEGVLDGLRQAVNQLAEQDSTGLVSLANGQYTSKIRENFGVEESSPLVRGALGQIPPTDVIPAMLTPGEVVIPKAIADKYPGLLDMLRHDAVGAYAEGGTVGFFGPTDRAFEAGGSKHADTVKQWSSAQADSDAVGSGAPLTVLKQATAGQLAAQEMYKGLVGFAGLAGFASEEFKSLLSGGILNLGQETVQQLVEGFRNAAQEIPPSGDTIQGDQINGDVVTQQGNDPGAVIRNAAASIGLRL